MKQCSVVPFVHSHDHESYSTYPLVAQLQFHANLLFPAAHQSTGLDHTYFNYCNTRTHHLPRWATYGILTVLR